MLAAGRGWATLGRMMQGSCTRLAVANAHLPTLAACVGIHACELLGSMQHRTALKPPTLLLLPQPVPRERAAAAAA